MKRLKDYDIAFSPENQKTLSFSMNFVEIIEEETKEDVATWLKSIDKKGEKEQALAICDIVFAACKAYDLEEDIPVNYNKFKVRKWCQGLSETQINDLVKYLFSTISVEEEVKKQKQA